MNIQDPGNWHLLRRIGQAEDTTELRRLLSVINNLQRNLSTDPHITIGTNFARGLIMLKASRDFQEHAWMYTQPDSAMSALTHFNGALTGIRNLLQDGATRGSEALRFKRIERHSTYEAMVAISILETWGVQVPAESRPNTEPLFDSEILDIEKSREFGWILGSHLLPPKSRRT